MINEIEYLELANTLHQKAVLGSADIGFSCVIGGEPRLAPGTPHTEFWFRCGQSLTVIESERQWTRTVGILQFTIYGPHWCDEQDVQDLGDLISKAFGHKKFDVPPDGHVVTERMEAVVLPSSRRRKMLIGIADAGFDYYRAG